MPDSTTAVPAAAATTPIVTTAIPLALTDDAKTAEAAVAVAEHPSIAGAEGLLPSVYADIGPTTEAIQETKAGYKTTEFWSVLIAAGYSVATTAPVHNKLYVSALAAIYAIARGIAKAGTPASVKTS